VNVQREIYDAVKARGYRDGWTVEQFAARQAAKLAEELGELVACIHQVYGVTMYWEDELKRGADGGRDEFDDGDWAGAAIEDPYTALDELADIVVVACCLAEALAEFEPPAAVDLLEHALKKAKADVKRGVRRC
jgi:NTP pyrophosphatase (non-canonical NTP hydrolase)